MINWRKPVSQIIYSMAGNVTLDCLKYLKSVEYSSCQKLQSLQEEKLERLLLHCYENVPYYRKMLPEAGVIKGKTVLLERFERIPILTKEVLRSQAAGLCSTDYRQRGYYTNQTGGSTGEPVTFIQDIQYKAWGMACSLYLHSVAGRDIGEPLLKLWGSERDVFRNAEKLSTRLEQWLSNTVTLNSFLMSDERMARYVWKWDTFKPKLVVAYTSSIHEFARYVRHTGHILPSPKAIICCAETLGENVRAYIENVFDCPVLNYYGGRDIGAVAFECQKKEGLHIFNMHTKGETLNQDNCPCKPAEMGHLIVTNLDNFSMPLIRYKTGDTAVPSDKALCSCGRGWPLIQKVTGREMEIFRTREGTPVPGEFFIHAVGVVYNKDYITKFQVIQNDYDHITIKVVVKNQKGFEESRGPLVNSIRNVMGKDCKVNFELVDDIERAQSGKFQYTISKVASQ